MTVKLNMKATRQEYESRISRRGRSKTCQHIRGANPKDDNRKVMFSEESLTLKINSVIERHRILKI